MRHLHPTRRELARLGLAAALPAAEAEDDSKASIRKAMDAVSAAIPKADSDPERPSYHFRPPAQWNNDPNGTLYYKGWHHLFYQHNPFEAKWGHMHWGHARSRDLVNWEHLPIALWPSIEKGEEHVFSGAALAGAGERPRLMYTSIGNRDPEQWLAEPVDDELITWRKDPRNPAATLKLHGALKVGDWRDPFLFREGAEIYMVCGGNGSSRRRSGTAAVYLYQAAKRDLSEWRFRGPVFEYRDQGVINIECPNLFKLGSKWVLLISPHKPCEYFAGDLDLKRGRFLPETHGVLDPGTSYASNISIDDGGRTILWLWGRTATDPQKGWNSVMGMPRILTIGDDGFLRQNPASEFESLRGEARRLPSLLLDGQPLKLGHEYSGDCLEIEAEFTLDTAYAAGLRLRCSSSGKSGIQVAYSTSQAALTAGNAAAMIGSERRIRMRVYLDHRVAEAYANDGVGAIFTTVDAAPGDLGIEVYAQAARRGWIRSQSGRSVPRDSALTASSRESEQCHVIRHGQRQRSEPDNGGMNV